MGIRKRKKRKRSVEFETSDRIFAACAGAAIYRREFLEKTGLFDEEHFAYLEDTDIGYRARLLGYENWYEPSAKVTTSEAERAAPGITSLNPLFFQEQYLSDLIKYVRFYRFCLTCRPLSFGFSANWSFCIEGIRKRISGRNQEWFFHLPEAGKQSKKDPFRVEAPRHVFCHRMGAFINVFRRFLERA